ncbi:alpha-2-macroglobulin receptor-associated protein-like [Tropilaelaps mercedesae]|uniref:Alpha-2-macroglobulin receptor-associated protein-like n=1 Tax=Tropilaelaps mercedesae TaxID=418985 RepID=A0A1V9XRY2_9ACAR|nr:alpha-2-macroglobulin receptor-associated protein-like [Tropilaelaps mercedesae]
MRHIFLFVVAALACVGLAVAGGSRKDEFRKDYKYSKEANEKSRQKARNVKDETDFEKKETGDRNEDKVDTGANDPDDYYRPPKNYSTSTERLFRMQKLHNIWQKGQKVLNEVKLKALFHDLKTQDKREVEFKRIKSQGKDKDGLKEAALRAQLSGIVNSYGLLGSFPEYEVREEDALQIERMFKDKKLNKLWDKIEGAGLDEKEMKILKEELEHHQLKVDQYYAFVDNLHDARDKTPELENSLEHFLEDEVVKGEHDHKDAEGKARRKDKMAEKEAKKQFVEEIRIKHQELKSDFDTLAERVRAKLNEREFDDAKTVRLWELAKSADFTKEELTSLRGELHHFEHRMKKLHHYSNELELKQNPDEAKPLKSKVAELQHKVEKMHNELRGRIARRTEL